MLERLLCHAVGVWRSFLGDIGVCGYLFAAVIEGEVEGGVESLRSEDRGRETFQVHQMASSR
jgi:hypothetical protein